LTGAVLRRSLESFYRAALRAVDPGAAVQRAVVRHGETLTIDGERLHAGARLGVVAVGKAAAAMAAALEVSAGDAIAFGLAITKDGHGLPLARMALREAAHPVPDARSEAAGRAALAHVRQCPPPDVLVVALSGGASSLWSCPLPGLSLEDVADTTRRLLAAGAPIDELNAVRKHLCELAGGRLAREAAAPRIRVLALSDVPGDRLDVLASGPCAPDPTRFADALAALARRLPAAEVPDAVRMHLEAGARGERSESPKPGDPCFARVRTALLASNRTALAAAAEAAGAEGWEVRIEPSLLEGEAREVGRRLAARARGERAGMPLCIIAGGETTVRVRGDGLGGRSQELALAAALELAGTNGIGLLAAGTDGTDGPTDAAGAFADGETLQRARARGLDATSALARNDSYHFFAGEGGLVRTGPTRTNVMDLVLIGVAPQGANPGYRSASESL
jgi:hydroxypyruvate reductase